MKAITCTQCGAVIDDVSDTSALVTCDYCGARMMMPSEPAAVPRAAVRPQLPAADPVPNRQAPAGGRSLVIAGITGIAILASLAAGLVGIVGAFKKDEPAAFRPATPYTAPTISPIVFENKPVQPAIKYKSRMSWNGPNDIEHFEQPIVDISSIDETDAKKLKEIAFKERLAKVRVTINTAGEVTSADPISGNPILTAASVESAKKCLFAPRSKPTTRILTYTYRALPD